MASNQRNNSRVALDLEIDYADLESFCRDYIRNISRGGVFIETRSPLELGTSLKLKFRLPGSDRPITAEGVVAWLVDSDEAEQEKSPPGMGVKFGTLSETDLEMIDALVLTEMSE